LALIWFDNSTVEAPLLAYMPIPTVFRLSAFLLCALNKVFSETGPNSVFGTSESISTFSLFFLFFCCFIVSMFD